MIKLGDRVKDKITGYEGIAVANTTWLHGCERITVQSENLQENGAPVRSATFDMAQLELIATPKEVKEEKLELLRPAGERTEPAREQDPS